MKKITLSGCLTKIVLTFIVIIGFIYCFSLLFPRAYNVLEAKALGIDTDTTTVVYQPSHNVDTLKKDSTIANQNVWTVKLEHENNCYLIPTKVNGVPMKMLLDTGASNLTMSIVEYMFLKKQNLLHDTTAQTSQATIANGETVNCYTIKLYEVTIGNKTIKDVECNVMEQQDAPLLLGMNVLKRLGNVSIDYKNNLLKIEE